MLLSKILAPKLRSLSRLHRNIDRQAKTYRISQWQSMVTHQKNQQEALVQLFEHCWNNIPYYETIFKSLGLTRPHQIKLESLPILTKQMIRENFKQLTSQDLQERQWYLTKSGGSTGEPVTIIQDWDYRIRSEGKKVVCFEWAGYEFGNSLIKLWGSERDILAAKNGWRALLTNYLANRQTLNSFLMGPDQMRHYLHLINQVQPKNIHAYAQSIFSLATFAKTNGIRIKPPQTIITTSETLYPFMRERIQEVFNCPIYDQYGSREVSCIASQCSHQGLHVNMETLLLEVVDEDGKVCEPGVEGEILVTSLVNDAMPLIRYKLGDQGILDNRACSCGRGLQLLKQVSGRSIDCFRRLDGSLIPGEYFIHFLGVVFNDGWVKQVQVIQEEYDFVRVRIVPSNHNGPHDIDQVKKIVRLVMGEGCRVGIEMESYIEPSKSGKFRYTVCNLDQN